MGFECLICNDCLEVPAPAYEKTEEELVQAGSLAPPTVLTRSRVQKSPAKKPNIRDGTPTDIVVTPCGHMYHRVCVARWFKDKNTMDCPACRKTCQQSKLIRIFPTEMMYLPSSVNFQLQPPPPIVLNPAETPTVSKPTTSSISSFPQPTSTFRIPEFLASETATRQQNSIGPGSARKSQISSGTAEVMFSTANSEHRSGPFGYQGCSLVSHVRGSDQYMEPELHPPHQPQRPEGQACNLPGCQDFRIIHQTLIHDFGDIQRKYLEGLEELTLKRDQEGIYDAMLKSQVDRIAALEGERDRALEQLTTQASLSIIEQQMGKTNGQSGVKHQSLRTHLKRYRTDDNPPAGGNHMI